MVFNGIDERRRAFQFLEYNCHVGVERLPNLIMQKLLATFGAENEMDVKTSERLRHDLGRPFRALACRYLFPGRCPGLWLGRPVGAESSTTILQPLA